uniref:DNA 5'-3' helicase n=1 Tax=Romanomermis culicivorax TaxID=13658 RepID=A0A915IPR1_ROMCU
MNEYQKNRLSLASERINYNIAYSLKIWCLNPAVAFSDIGPEAWSVILASGTLSPFDTFESELGVQFPIRLEADHVLPFERMMIRGIGRGPNSFPLKALYSETQNFKFMDELGSLLLRICRTVPAGVLCFLSSYSLLNNLEQRWRDTKLWEMISVFKLLVKEPRTTSEMKERLTEFTGAIKNPFQYGDDCTGSLLFAVYRGKVAEGIDFADDLARAVICVGIPYANVRVPEIDLKRKYNDQWRVSRKLLSGQEWYENQAYRALNQALGRCLRHRKDWGALFLVDERFSNASRVLKLSKWMRANFKFADNFDVCAEELDKFITKMARENDGENLLSDFSNRDFFVAKDPSTSNPPSSTFSSKLSPSPRRFTFTTKRNRYAIFTESPSSTDDGDVIVVDDDEESLDNGSSHRQTTIDDKPKTNGRFFTRMVTLKRPESKK